MDARWGPLCGRVQLLAQLNEGATAQSLRRSSLLAVCGWCFDNPLLHCITGLDNSRRNAVEEALRAAGAAIVGYLPTDTWLLLADANALARTGVKDAALVRWGMSSIR